MIVSHLVLIIHKKIQFYIFMFEAWNVAKGRKVQGGRILSQGTVHALNQGMGNIFGGLQRTRKKGIWAYLQVESQSQGESHKLREGIFTRGGI